MTSTRKAGTGRVIFFDNVRGWGFLDSNGMRVFFHLRNSAPGLYVELGMTFGFDFAPPFKMGQGEQAINLRDVANEFATGVLNASGKVGA